MLKLSAPKKRFGLFVIGGWILLILSNQVEEFRLYQGAFVATYALAIASIILLTGYSGQLSLGHGALMAVGAYAAALAINNLMWHPAVALVFAAFVAGLFGLLLGSAVARLSGPYLAGTTLALAVSLPSLANQFPILGGEQGLIFDVGAAPARFGEEFSQYKWFFWIASLAALIMVWFVVNIVSSRYGRTFRAMRDNSIAAELAGVNVGVHKLLAFTHQRRSRRIIWGIAGNANYRRIAKRIPAQPLIFSADRRGGYWRVQPKRCDPWGIGSGGYSRDRRFGSISNRRFGGACYNLAWLLVSALLILAVLFTPNGPGEY